MFFLLLRGMGFYFFQTVTPDNLQRRDSCRDYRIHNHPPSRPVISEANPLALQFLIYEYKGACSICPHLARVITNYIVKSFLICFFLPLHVLYNSWCLLLSVP